MKEKRRSDLEIENLKITTKILSTHNQELLKHVSNFACADDAERKDGKRRDIKFSPADHDPEIPEADDQEANIEEEAMMIKTIIQNVVKPRSGTTLNMHNDLRMKLDAAKTGRPQTKVSPEGPLGPDLDELPETKKGAHSVVTLQGLEGAVIRGHGATVGIRTSSSSSNSSDLTLEERTVQMPNIARGKNLVRRAGVINAPRKIVTGRGRASGRGKPKEDRDEKPEPKPTKVLKVDDSVFEDAETGNSATLPLGATTPCMRALANSIEVKSDPYSLKMISKGEPAKPVVTKDEKMDVSELRDAKQDDDHDTVSDTNLSDDQVCEEFPEVEEEKTERILERMGTSSSPGMLDLCDDIVMMLHPVTSTPKRTEGSSSSSTSTHSSMPPLADGWSGTSDSGNASDSSDALPSKAVAAQDTVTVNSEHWNLLMNAFNMLIFPCSRTILLPLSETQGTQLKTLSMMCTILHISFINYLLYLSRQPSYYYYVVNISGANVLKESLLIDFNFALGNKH